MRGRGVDEALIESRPQCRGASVVKAQQLRQLGEVRRHATGFVLAEQRGRRVPTSLVLEIEIPQRLPGAVADDISKNSICQLPQVPVSLPSQVKIGKGVNC
jgi:hypothetical protein